MNQKKLERNLSRFSCIHVVLCLDCLASRQKVAMQTRVTDFDCRPYLSASLTDNEPHLVVSSRKVWKQQSLLKPKLMSKSHNLTRVHRCKVSDCAN